MTREFRPIEEHDLPTLLEWLSRTHVTEWWEKAPTPNEARAEFPVSVE